MYSQTIGGKLNISKIYRNYKQNVCSVYAHDYQDENSQKKVYHLKKYIQVTLEPTPFWNLVFIIFKNLDDFDLTNPIVRKKTAN